MVNPTPRPRVCEAWMSVTLSEGVRSIVERGTLSGGVRTLILRAPSCSFTGGR